MHGNEQPLFASVLII